MQTQSQMFEVTDRLRRPTEIVGSFVTNGALAPDPSQFGAHVVAVQRLQTATPRPFFRVTFAEPLPNLASARTTILRDVEGPEGTDATMNVSRSGFTASPAAAFTPGLQLDVQILESGTAIDTAGRRVNLRILLDQDQATVGP